MVQSFYSYRKICFKGIEFCIHYVILEILLVADSNTAISDYNFSIR